MWKPTALLCMLAMAFSSCDDAVNGGQAFNLGGSTRPATPTASPIAGAADADSYAILLTTLNNPATHVQDAQVYQQRLAQGLGWKGVFVLNKAGSSEVFWGKYRTLEAAEPNLRIAKNHRTQAGTKPFAQAIIVPLPGADIGPPEWNLRNSQAPYTMLIATFRDDPARNYVGRRKFAVDYCRRLRQGNYEAYFFHFPAMSIVTIGAFGSQAVRGKGDQAQIVDLKALSIQQDFPMLAINGNGENNVIRDANGKIVLVPLKTTLIEVPRTNDRGETLPSTGGPKPAVGAAPVARADAAASRPAPAPFAPPAGADTRDPMQRIP